MAIGDVYQKMLTGLYPLKDNIYKVIAEMSPCPQLLWIRWMLKTGASGRRYRKITWTVGVVEFGDSGRCVRPQNRTWASSQWEAENNQWKAKKWAVGITMVNEKEELLQVTREL